MTNHCTPVSVKFEASNGLLVEHFIDKSTLLGGRALGTEESVAFLEFATSQRDKELGRWRSKERPDWVVCPLSDNRVRLLNEISGSSFHLARTGDIRTDEQALVAREYFDAHPKKEPWKAAKPGEVWSVTFNGQDHDVTCVNTDFGLRFFARTFLYSTTHPGISAGVRLYPEEKS